MTAAKQISLIDVDEYLSGELNSSVKHEYSGGYVYAMAGGSNNHNTIASNWLGLVHAHLRGKRCRAFNSDTKVRVRFPTHTRFYYPDGMVVCDSNSGETSFQDQPVVIVEVISRATRRIDETEKRDAYLTIPSLFAYLIVETEAPKVLVHRRTNSVFIAEVYEGLSATIELAPIGVTLLLADLYERVEFVPEPADEDPA